MSIQRNCFVVFIVVEEVLSQINDWHVVVVGYPSEQFRNSVVCFVHKPGRDVTRPQPHEAEAEAEATTHEAEAEAEATTHEAEAEAEATTHEAEAEAEAKTHLEILIIITVSN